MELSNTTIALLFPAIPLMFLVYANSSLAIGARVRDLYEAFSSGKKDATEIERITKEADYLIKRLKLLRYCQILSGSTFLFNVIALIFIFLENQFWGKLVFSAAVLSLMSSIVLYLWEITLSVKGINYLSAQMRKGPSKP